jgi:hypothetical protein
MFQSTKTSLTKVIEYWYQNNEANQQRLFIVASAQRRLSQSRHPSPLEVVI